MTGKSGSIKLNVVKKYQRQKIHNIKQSWKIDLKSLIMQFTLVAYPNLQRDIPVASTLSHPTTMNNHFFYSHIL